MSSIDDFLGELTNQQKDKQHKSNVEQDNIDNYLSQLQSTSAQESNAQIPDNLLEEIEDNYQQKKQHDSNRSNELLSDLETQFKQAQQETKKARIADQTLDEITNQFQEKREEYDIDDIEAIKKEELQRQREEKLLRQQEELRKKQAEAERKRQELAKIQREKELKAQAQKWLKNLDPNSDEGFWFEQFAMSYNSKQQAAIEYLRALQSPTE